MTENKRFTYSGVTATEIEVYEDGEYFGETCHSGICNTFVDKAVNKLNQQYNTIQDLKKENKQLKELQNELYDFRLVYNALLFNEWFKIYSDIIVYKSRRHYDGSIPFDDPNWFIVVAILPSGKQITNHYHIDYWNYFKIPEKEKVEHEFDEHTSQDVLKRLKEVL